jgi:hypothetical protein
MPVTGLEYTMTLEAAAMAETLVSDPMVTPLRGLPR